MKHLLAAGMLAWFACSTSSAASPDDDAALQAAVAGAHRTPAFVRRDDQRRPLQTLAFFGIQPTMKVVEISPGGAWYTEILAPYLRQRGHLTLAADDPASVQDYYRRSAERLRIKLAAQPDVYDRVALSLFEPPGQLLALPPASVDMVLTFRNVHNWAADGDEKVLAVFRSALAVLKPGGVFGVVDHRLPADRPADPKVANGYLHQSYVVALAEKAGFALAAASEINANAKDKADHAGGVWALPPTFRNKEQDRARYAAIGESDRMTLRFVKP